MLRRSVRRSNVLPMLVVALVLLLGTGCSQAGAGAKPAAEPTTPLYVPPKTPTPTPEPPNPPGMPEEAERAQVTSVLDSATITVRLDGRVTSVRLLGISGPADVGNSSVAECREAAATGRLATMLPKGRTVYLEADRSGRDGEQRLPRYVWFPGKDDGKPRLANEILVREGFATAESRRPDTKYADRLAQAQTAASAEGLGPGLSCPDDADSASSPGQIGKDEEVIEPTRQEAPPTQGETEPQGENEQPAGDDAPTGVGTSQEGVVDGDGDRVGETVQPAPGSGPRQVALNPDQLLALLASTPFEDWELPKGTVAGITSSVNEDASIPGLGSLTVDVEGNFDIHYAVFETPEDAQAAVERTVQRWNQTAMYRRSAVAYPLPRSPYPAVVIVADLEDITGLAEVVCKVQVNNVVITIFGLEQMAGLDTQMLVGDVATTAMARAAVAHLERVV
ncbi:MAG: thermonuclease family protein [Chloroflexota bacterium]|nr:thermonuclease family protein [Chloroflexota bacterium]